MKHAIALAVLLLVVCVPAQGASPKLDVSLAQIGTPARDLFYMSGPINVQYALTVHNPTSTPYTLKQLELETVSPGAYALHTGAQTVKQPIPPGDTTIKFSTWGRALGGYLRAEEPVTIRGIAHFEGPKGQKFTKIFTQTLSQF